MTYTYTTNFKLIMLGIKPSIKTVNIFFLKEIYELKSALPTALLCSSISIPSYLEGH